MSTVTKARQRVKPVRSIRLALPPFEGNPGVVRITVGKASTDYLLQPIPCEVGGAAFQLTKVGPEADGEVYHVRLTGNPRQDSCDCKGFAKHSHCKHRDGLAALAKAGRL